ncbi:hypothetical protein [Pseudoalteromonas sp. MMG022]|uniref:hypothetical protein n=1 Tax=Pseudoalteromonas sp. MMG022 TaxID=2909978 RepID=UPI001F423637|nr:hypothetical protein [Pseudoalteromonas sp. MMG022]MCF6436999.1 hypothetical protein [Pseudoalteromonas sp. MMG022]
MNDLQFRQTEAISDFQMLSLVVISVLLVAIYLYLKLVYTKKHKTSDGVKVLSKTRLSQHSVVYELCTEHKKYVVFESKAGVIELKGEALPLDGDSDE